MQKTSATKDQDKLRLGGKGDPLGIVQEVETRSFLNWTREKLRQRNPKARKLMSMHKALHPRDDIKRLYVTRK